MAYLINMLSILLLQIMWKLKNFYDSYLNIGREVRESKADEPQIDLISSKRSSEPSEKIFFYPVGRKTINHTHTDRVFSPDEEEMLRYLCAKGFPRSTNVSRVFTSAKPLRLKRLPRSTYTAIWLDSCARQ